MTKYTAASIMIAAINDKFAPICLSKMSYANLATSPTIIGKSRKIKSLWLYLPNFTHFLYPFSLNLITLILSSAISKFHFCNFLVRT